METLLGEVQNVIESVNNPSMKEVKGLEDRLSKLEQLMFGARRLLQEQGEMSQVRRRVVDTVTDSLYSVSAWISKGQGAVSAKKQFAL
jgi:t-SNARE complex subunit (syntaxin)